MGTASGGVQIRVIGPKVGGETEEGVAYAVPAATAQQLVGMFQAHLSAKRTGPLQMLVDAPDVPPSVVNLYRYYGTSAVAHVLRASAGEVPALAGIYLLLPGLDRDADEAAIAAVESSRDATGTMLPLRPQIFQSLRADARPLIALLFFNVEALKDVSLRMLAVCLAEAFFATVKPGQAGTPGG